MQAIRLTLYIAAVASAAAAQPEFEVASVKPAAPVTGHFQYHATMKVDAAMVDISNASPTDLVRTAYRVNSYQICGPDWMAAQKFDVVTKLPAAGAVKYAAQEQIPEMLQALLAPRFQLDSIRELRPLFRGDCQQNRPSRNLCPKKLRDYSPKARSPRHG
jgi:hypothetical protein